MSETVSETVVCPDNADSALVGDEPPVLGVSAVEVSVVEASVVEVSVVAVSVAEVSLLEFAVALPPPEVPEPELALVVSLVVGIPVWVVPVDAPPELEVSVV